MAKRFSPPSARPDPLIDATDAPRADTLHDDGADLRDVLPEHERTAPGVDLFLDACLTYGVDPSEEATPIEIPTPAGATRPRWVHYPTNPRMLNPKPERIAFVTSGGVKLVHPLDEDCERTIRRWLQAFHLDPKTREIVDDPLPADLTLPRQAITGEVLSAKHQYREGYMRARADAARTA